MVDRRKKGHRELCERLLAEREAVMRTVIPMSVRVENMAQRRAPLVAEDTRSAAALAYRELWQELRERIPGLADADRRTGHLTGR
jgi:cellulose biosynthesis protein BcsQ